MWLEFPWSPDDCRLFLYGKQDVFSKKTFSQMFLNKFINNVSHKVLISYQTSNALLGVQYVFISVTKVTEFEGAELI